MKKLFFLLLFIPSLAFSQEVGIKAGANFSNYHAYSNFNNKSLTSPLIGLYVQYYFNKFSISVEPTYLQNGTTSNFIITNNSGNTISTEKTKIKFTYLELPIVVHYSFLDESFLFGISGGLSANFLIAGKTKNSQFSDPISHTNWATFDFLVGTYIGYKISDKTNIKLNIRYGHSLTNPVNTINSKFNYLQTFFTFGYRLKSK